MATKSHDGLPVKLWPLFQGVRRLLRHFPYTEMLVLFLPLYAYLIAGGKITSPWTLIYIVPFIFADAAGFVFNDMMDIRDPATKKNPIVAGELTKQQAQLLLLICLAVSIVLFLEFYSSIASRLIYFGYLFLCLSYSGLGIRFKETLIGPLVASFIVWIGGPFVFAIEHDILNIATIELLAGSFLIYVGREMLHMIVDYEHDVMSGYKTFSVRVSLPTQYAIKAFTFCVGSILLIASVNSYLGERLGTIDIVLLWLVIGGAALFEIAACRGNTLFDHRVPYMTIRFFLVLLTILILNFSSIIAALVIWIYITSKRG